MKPFFRFPERREILLDEVNTWLGTPFHKRSCAKGLDGGVDCVGLAQDVYFTLGVIPEVYPLPDYPIDWHKHNEHSLLEDFIDLYYSDCFLVVEAGEQPMVGDLLGMVPRGKCIHHAGIAHRPGMMAHAMQKKGVIESHLNGSSYGMELGKIFRPIES